MTDATDAIQALTAIGGDAPRTEAAGSSVQAVEKSEFIELLSEIDQSVASANEALATVARGESDAPIHELMISLEVSRLQLQMLVEVRNRVVEGYQELTRMQV